MKKISIIILLMICLSSLLLTGCEEIGITPEIDSENSEYQVDTEDPGTESPQKWSGLGIGLFSEGKSAKTASQFDNNVDELLANGFTELRIDIPDYQDNSQMTPSKVAVKRAIAKGAKVIWGVSSNSFNNLAHTITDKNWSKFRQAILDAAQWAQDNEVYEFQLGNEEELHIDGTTMTITGIITNLKSVATDAQEIFTNGNVSYSCWQGSIDDWITAGKGDIDILASNVYIGGEGYYSGNEWETRITNLVNAFGVDGTYITEFAPSYSSLEDYSTDEAVQAIAVAEMIEYIKASGIERAFYFCYQNDDFGVMKFDGGYRQLWSQALLNEGPVKSTTVPATTKPDTIAFMPKITR